MHNGQLHRLLGDIVDGPGAGRLRACDLSTYPGRALRRKWSRVCLRDAVHSVRPPRPLGRHARGRRPSTQAHNPSFGGRYGVSISGYRTSRICFLLRRKSTYGAATRAGRFSRRPRLPIGSFRIPAKAAPVKAMTAVFVRPPVSVPTYFAEGLFRRIPIRNGTVAVESISPTATQRAHGRIDKCRAMPPLLRKTISLPSSQ
jgi:hypothetical protein